MAAPSLPLFSDRNAAFGHLASFTWQRLPADSVQREVHIPAALSLWSQHRGAEGRAGSPLSQAAIPHCYNNTCCSSSHRGVKRGLWPQLFLRPPACKIQFVWGWEGPLGFGTGFPRAIDGLVRDDSSTIQVGEKRRKKIAKRRKQLHSGPPSCAPMTVITSSRWLLLPTHF